MEYDAHDDEHEGQAAHDPEESGVVVAPGPAVVVGRVLWNRVKRIQYTRICNCHGFGRSINEVFELTHAPGSLVEVLHLVPRLAAADVKVVMALGVPVNPLALLVQVAELVIPGFYRQNAEQIRMVFYVLLK